MQKPSKEEEREIKRIIGHKFPGPMPVSFEKKHINVLKKYTYFMAEKSDGVRYLLLCFYFKDYAYSVLINRKMEFFIVSLCFSVDVFEKTTLLDGELVDDVFIVFDCYTFKGQDLSSHRFSQRLEHAQQIVNEKIYNYDPECLHYMIKDIVVKPFYRDLNFEFSDKNDGCIMMPDELPVVKGTHWSLFKWKSNHTVDFIIDSDYILYSLDKGNLVKTGECNDCDLLDQLFNVFDDSDQRYLVECEYKESEWVPFKVRTDKSHPNNLLTLERTMVNIQENITFNDLKNITIM